MLRLETLDGLALTNRQEERTQPHRRLALLARLARSGPKGVSRHDLLRCSFDQWADTVRSQLTAAATLGHARPHLPWRHS